MIEIILQIANGQVGLPDEWVKASLVVALIGACVVVALFYYLNWHTRMVYFQMWTVAWMLNAVYLATAIGLEEHPGVPWLVMARRACIGWSALFMFWGSFQLANLPRPWRELKLGVVMILIWSGLAAFCVRNPFWITMPVFALLAGAGVYTSLRYFRVRCQYRGAKILAWGFMFWGLHLLLFPFMENSVSTQLLGYLLSGGFAMMIAVGMVVEQEVNLAEQSYRQLLDASSDAIFLVDMQSLRVLEVNRVSVELTRRSAVELVGSYFPDLCESLTGLGLDKAQNLQRLQTLFRTSQEFKIRRPDGVQLDCEGDMEVVKWHQQDVLQISMRDLTGRKQAGQQLRRAEKLSALGQLVAGVAHELNNPLAVAMGYAQVLANRPGVDAKTQRDIMRMYRECERASTIVRDLLSFARPSEPQMRTVHMNDLVQYVLECQSSALESAGIEVRRTLAAHLPRTKCDTHQIEQILANLISNAIQALQGRDEPRVLTVGTSLNGRFIRLSVADNGPGIAPEIFDKIFDPFFTTHPPGKGTGLGLTISNSMAQEHRGKLSVESEPGQGATFHLDLPVVACTDAQTDDMAPDENTGVATGPARRLLLVDDEPGILDVLRDVLTNCGYVCDTASNGEEALSRLNSAHYDLLISDLRMPDMDGETLFKTLQSKRPALSQRIIFLTGDTVSTQSRGFLESTGNRWLSKPFNVRDIERAVSDSFRQWDNAVGRN